MPTLVRSAVLMFINLLAVGHPSHRVRFRSEMSKNQGCAHLHSFTGYIYHEDVKVTEGIMEAQNISNFLQFSPLPCPLTLERLYDLRKVKQDVQLIIDCSSCMLRNLHDVCLFRNVI
jgi:hypothetical protein